MSLKRTPLPAHDFPDTGEVRECPDCGAEWDTREYDSPPPWPCKREPIERTSAPKPVSDRRLEKRKARGIRGPLCDHVRGSICAVEGCQGRSDPAHVDSVNSGGADLERVEGRWVGRIAPLCREHHRQYDGKLGGGSNERFEERVGLDVADAAEVAGLIWMARENVDAESEVHPYEQIGWDGR